MPDRGLLSNTSVEDVRLGESPLVLTGASWLQVTFEVPREAALAFMPPEASRPIPPYARLLVVTCPERSLAVLSVGSRFRMLPRNAVAASVSQGEPAVEWLGSGGVTGDISLIRDGARVEATVGVDGHLLARATLPAIYAIEPTMLRWDSMLVSGRDGGTPVLADVEVTPVLESAFLSKGATIALQGADPASPWRRLRSVVTISACFAEGTMVLSEPAVQQTWS